MDEEGSGRTWDRTRGKRARVESVSKGSIRMGAAGDCGSRRSRRSDRRVGRRQYLSDVIGTSLVLRPRGACRPRGRERYGGHPQHKVVVPEDD